jgi:hypothetical protein
MLTLAIVVLGFLGRVLIHIPNFSPVIALALFGGAMLNRKTAVILPVALLAATDIILGLHNTMPFTWGSIIIIAVLGRLLSEHKNVKNIALFSVVSAVIFFIITNLGCWITMYPLNLAGLQQCFIAALPFFNSTLVSTLIYSAVLFGGYAMLAARIQKTSLAKVLLSPRD